MCLFKRKQKKTIETTDTLILSRYTREVWTLLNADGHKSDFESVMHPDNVDAFIRQSVSTLLQIDKGAINGIKKILIATIGKNYILWTKQNHERFTKESVRKYVVEKKQDEAYWNNELNENGHNTSTHVIGIVFTIETNSDNTEYKLSENAINTIEKVFSEVYRSKVFCPGWILKNEDAFDSIKKITNIAEYNWESGLCANLVEYNVQKNLQTSKNADGTISLFIPFVFKTDIKQAVFSVNTKDTSIEERLQFAPNCIDIEKEKMQKIEEALRVDFDTFTGLHYNIVSPLTATLDQRTKRLIKKDKDDSDTQNTTGLYD